MSTERVIVSPTRRKVVLDEPVTEPGPARDGDIRSLKISLKHELQLARQIRAEAEQYRVATGVRARSEAQQLILDIRLAIKREISKLEVEASEEAKKLLIDIRLIRLAAQQELDAQRQFTNAARINALSTVPGDDPRPVKKAKGSGSKESA